MNNYPAGAENDPRAPWNQLSEEEQEELYRRQAYDEMMRDAQWEAEEEERALLRREKEERCR